MRTIAVTVAMTVLVGCAVPPPKSTKPKPPPEPRVAVAISAQQEAAAKAVIVEMLKDPESARFSDVVGVERVSAPGSVVICGKVNAKNSYGGYVGSVPFMVAGSKGQLWDSTSPYANIMNSLILELCTPTTTSAAPVQPASSPAQVQPSTSSPAPQMLSPEQWKQQQIDRLNRETGLSYEEYQRRYKAITAQ